MKTIRCVSTPNKRLSALIDHALGAAKNNRPFCARYRVCHFRADNIHKYLCFSKHGCHDYSRAAGEYFTQEIQYSSLSQCQSSRYGFLLVSVFAALRSHNCCGNRNSTAGCRTLLFCDGSFLGAVCAVLFLRTGFISTNDRCCGDRVWQETGLECNLDIMFNINYPNKKINTENTEWLNEQDFVGVLQYFNFFLLFKE